jgi:hypothetical protein
MFGDTDLVLSLAGVMGALEGGIGERMRGKRLFQSCWSTVGGKKKYVDWRERLYSDPGEREPRERTSLM